MLQLRTLYLLILQSLIWYHGHGGLQAPKIDVGVSGVVANITLYGGIIVNDKKSITTSLYSHLEAHAHVEHNKTHVSEILETRQRNIKNLTSILPFELLQWPVINTRPCPNYQHTGHNRVERGQGMSHMQIWLEFLFFDVDVLDARVRKVPEFITSNDYSSVSGVFQSVQNGSLYKNKIPFLDEDIMIVLEDTALLLPNITTNEGAKDENTHTESVISVVSSHLRKTLSDIKADIISLGVISVDVAGRQLTEQSASTSHAAQDNTHNPSAQGKHGTHPTHATSHITNTHSAHNDAHSSTFTPYAYAITRAGARRLVGCYDHCGHLLREQILACVEGELVSHAHAVYPMFMQDT